MEDEGDQDLFLCFVRELRLLGIKETPGRAWEQVNRLLESNTIYWNLNKQPKNSQNLANEEDTGSGRVKWKVLEKPNNENGPDSNKRSLEGYLMCFDCRCDQPFFKHSHYLRKKLRVECFHFTHR